MTTTAHVPRISGRLGRTLHLRRADPEAPIVVESREPLVYMLCEAAELEHSLMCEYLYAALSLKRSTQEGITETQLHAIEQWRRAILDVAKQEMLHLAINANLLASLGASPHLTRPNLPQPSRHYPTGVTIALLPFSEAALRHFLFMERPEGLTMDDAEGIAAMQHAVPHAGAEEIAPHLQEFATVGHLYRSIADGMTHLSVKWGEERLFLCGHEDEASGALFGWPELVPITGLNDALRSVETIVEQGEGVAGSWRDAHFGRFLRVLSGFLAERERDPEFEPARPVLPALVRPPATGEQATLITDARTARIADVCNVAYEVLLQLLYRLFSRVDETVAQVETLADVAVSMMFDIVEPLGDLLTRLPVGPEHPNHTAGPTFELFYEPDYLLPHRRAAWIVTSEHLALAATVLQPEVASLPELAAVESALRDHARTLEESAG
ncbi:MAG: ferritin-like protein [Candidatus Dormibacteraeota bacterium]|nr:ferritin-like protein [Candidatus Dormibacteraeota bacterium]